MKQILYIEIDELIKEIESGKKDLFTVILDYRKEINELTDKLDKIEEVYLDRIDELETKVNELEFEIDELEFKNRELVVH